MAQTDKHLEKLDYSCADSLRDPSDTYLSSLHPRRAAFAHGPMNG